MSRQKSDPGRTPSRRRDVWETAREQADRNLRNGQLSAALEWARQVLRAAPGTRPFADWLIAGKVFATNKDPSGVRQVFDRLEREWPGDVGSKFALSCCLAEAGDGTSSVKAFEQFAARASSTIDHWLAWSQAMETGDAHELAIQSLAKRAASVPDKVPLQNEIARLMVRHGRADEAIPMLRELLNAGGGPGGEEQLSKGWFTLGVALESSDPAGSAEAYRAAIGLRPLYPTARSNLAILLMSGGQHDEAARLLEETRSLLPDRHDSLYLLARCRCFAGQLDEAIRLLNELVTAEAGHEAGWELLARCQYERGESEQAVETCRRWSKNCSESEVARHMLAAFSGAQIPERASAGYVAATFDQFADSFEATLKNLGYRVPEHFAVLLKKNLGEPTGKLDIVDAGCGTGLLGPVLKPWARTLTGVDLSPKMLEKSRASGYYDSIECTDLTTFLSAASGRFDLVLAADTFNYFGELEPVLRAAFVALRPGGWLMFSVEESQVVGDTWRLQPHGRYAHSPAYLKAQFGSLGVEDVRMDRVELRRENDKPVHGLLIAAQRP